LAAVAGQVGPSLPLPLAAAAVAVRAAQEVPAAHQAGRVEFLLQRPTARAEMALLELFWCPQQITPNGAAQVAAVLQELRVRAVLAGHLLGAAAVAGPEALTRQRRQMLLVGRAGAVACMLRAAAQQSEPMALPRPLEAMARMQIAVAAAVVAGVAERQLQHPRQAATAATVAEVEAVVVAVASA
jgi:hypothetical protein